MGHKGEDRYNYRSYGASRVDASEEETYHLISKITK
jgi:hypothetical protein